MTIERKEVASRRSLWLPRLDGLPRPFWYLWAGTLLNRLGTFVAPFMALYLTDEQGFSVARAGFVLTLFGLGSALSQPLGGALADQIGRRNTMVAGLSSAAVALVVLGAADTVVTLAVSCFVYGLCLDLYRPASAAAIVDLVSVADRPRAFALQFWAINLGFSIATPLGGFLASRDYWLLFVLDAAASLLFALLVLRGVPESRPEVTGDQGHFVDVVRDKLMVALVFAVMLQAVVYMQAYLTLPLAFAADGLGPASYGLAISLNGVLIVVLQPILIGLLVGFRGGPLLFCAMSIQGVGFGLTALADGMAGHIVAIVVWTLGEVLAAGLLGALVAALAPVRLRGRYMGAFGLAFGLAAFLAPAVGTQVLEHLGEGALWGGALAASVIAGVMLWLISAAAAQRSPES